MGTKVSYQEGENTLHPTWALNDTISIYYNGSTYHYIASELGDETVFSPSDPTHTLPSIDDNTTLYACYPKQNISGNTIAVKNLVWDFCWKTEKLLPHNYMRGVGIVKDGVLNIEFKHIYSYVKLVITKDYRGISGSKLFDLRFKSDTYTGCPFHDNTTYNLIDGQFAVAYSGSFYSDYQSFLEENTSYGLLDTQYIYFAIEPNTFYNLSLSIGEDLVYQAENFEFLPNTVYVLDPKMKTLTPDGGDFNNMPVIDL